MDQSDQHLSGWLLRPLEEAAKVTNMDKIDEMLLSQGLSKLRLAEVRNRLGGSAVSSDSVERCRVKGHLQILGVSKDRVWTVCDADNLVTNTGYLIMASMWGRPTSPETYDTLKPNRIAVGVGLESSPTASMTRLHMGGGTPYSLAPTYIAQVTQVLFTGSPNTNGCRFELLIPNGTGGDPYNGVTLQEAGLFCEDYSGSSTGVGGMIAYKTYPSITKTTDFSLLYAWTFSFAAA